MTYPESPRADRIGWSILTAACLIAWAILLSGCSSSRHVVDEQSAVVEARPDTVVSAVQPLPRADVATMPVEVHEFRSPDTSQAAPVTAVIIDRRDPDRQTYTIRTPNGSQTGQLPATGEVAVSEAQPDSTFAIRVGGKQIKVEAPPPEPPPWEEVSSGVTGVLALLGFFVLSVWIARRFV